MKMTESKSKKYKSAAREIAYIALSVALITVCAWISIPIAQIPVTLQTLAVALVGGLLGWKRGTASVFVYILMGLIGIPVFAGFRATEALFSATGGYIFGFLFTALIPGLFKIIPLKRSWARTGMLYAAMILGIAVLYFFGTVWFIFIFKCSVGYALAMCVVPYIVPDLVKTAIAAVLSVRLERYIR